MPGKLRTPLLLRLYDRRDSDDDMTVNGQGEVSPIYYKFIIPYICLTYTADSDDMYYL